MTESFDYPRFYFAAGTNAHFHSAFRAGRQRAVHRHPFAEAMFVGRFSAAESYSAAVALAVFVLVDMTESRNFALFHNVIADRAIPNFKSRSGAGGISGGPPFAGGMYARGGDIFEFPKMTYGTFVIFRALRNAGRFNGNDPFVTVSVFARGGDSFVYHDFIADRTIFISVTGRSAGRFGKDLPIGKNVFAAESGNGLDYLRSALNAESVFRAFFFAIGLSINSPFAGGMSRGEDLVFENFVTGKTFFIPLARGGAGGFGVDYPIARSMSVAESGDSFGLFGAALGTSSFFKPRFRASSGFRGLPFAEGVTGRRYGSGSDNGMANGTFLMADAFFFASGGNVFFPFAGGMFAGS